MELKYGIDDYTEKYVFTSNSLIQNLQLCKFLIDQVTIALDFYVLCLH